MHRISSSKSFNQLSQLLLVFAFYLSVSSLTRAQTSAEATKTPAAAVQSATNSANAKTDAFKAADALHTRIERARALIAAHRLNTAAGELELIKATTQEPAFRNIACIMLMNIYLEEASYTKAEALLEENFIARATKNDESLGAYFALAGQAVNGARSHLARYRAFGISTTDSSLPAEAVSDLSRLRSLLERMIAHAKEIAEGRRAYDSLSLLEDVLGLRLQLAKDNGDQNKWKSEYASAREALASSQTQIASLGGIPALRPAKTTVDTPLTPSPYSTKRAPEPASTQQPPRPSETATPSKSAAPGVANVDNTAPDTTEVSDLGSLSAFATRRVVPKYPPLAKQSGTTGLVRVYVIVEGGKVVSISGSEGPVPLRQAAEDAVRQWTFQVVAIEGRPTRLTGYIDFNFSL